MAEPIVVIEGADELARTLRSTGNRQLQSMLRAADRKSAEVVVRKALPNVPVRTGKLKASVRATGTRAFGEARAGNNRVVYAAAIHWGRGSGNTGFRHGRRAKKQGGGAIKGRPFLQDAANDSIDQVTDVYSAEIKKVLASMRLPSR